MDGMNVPMVIEVYDTIRRMKDNRAPGEDAIIAQLIKGGGRSLRKNIHQLIVSMWEKAEMSEEWRTAIICPIYKKAPLQHPYFDVVVGLVWSNDPESYADGSIATGRVSLAGQVKGDDPD
jgi:hypothetical protein